MSAPRGVAGAVCGVLLLATPCHVMAQTSALPGTGLAIDGRIRHPRHLTLAQLEALPASSVDVSPITPHGIAKARFTGVPLWALVQASEPVDAPGATHTYLQHTLLVRGRDGYAVAVAIGEIDPGFENKSILVAYEQDGHTMPALRLVVPLDAKAGRSVKDVVAIEVQ